jgi:hypothetical protein
MSSVNLTTYNENEKKQFRVSGGALSGLVAVLMLVLALWAFLFFYKKYYLDNNISKAKEESSGYVRKLNDDDSASVIDFHRRLEVSKKLVAQEKDMSEVLVQVESQIVPNVYLKSFSYDDTGSKITLNCNADNFNTVAKQIYGFKKSAYFSSVAAGTSTVDSQTNRIDFPVELIIGNGTNQ